MITPAEGLAFFISAIIELLLLVKLFSIFFLKSINVAAIGDLDNIVGSQQCAGRAVELPVWYAEESGQDLTVVAEHSGLSVQAVIELHSGNQYTAFATGFSPGFCYLGNISEQLDMPRLQTPRRAVPAGSVAIADRQTAVYPAVSPGGWHLLGRCPLPLFDLEQSPPGLIAVGDQVSFKPITRDEFLSLGGTL